MDAWSISKLSYPKRTYQLTTFSSYPMVCTLAKLESTDSQLNICCQLRGLRLSDRGAGSICNISFQWLASVGFGVCSMYFTSSSK